MKIQAIKICADGNIYPVEFGYNNLEKIHNLINCSNIEIVAPFRFCENMCIICDGEALLKESPQILREIVLRSDLNKFAKDTKRWFKSRS